MTFKYLVSSEEDDKATITLDSKTYGTISGIKEIEIKALLSAGKHSLNLSYEKDRMYKKGADRAFIYNLKTATTISDYVAQYDDTNTTLTFKKVTDANISDIVNNSVIVDQYNNVKEICTTLGNVTIKNIVFDESFKTYAPTSLKDFFKNCTALETISNIENLNTANVTNMTSMFDNCQNLSSLNLSKFNTENVTNMSYMFDNCQNLSSLDLSNFNTEKVREMYNMFSFCQKLSSLNLTNFNTEKVTNMDYMFNGCSDLTTIYASDKFIIAEFNNGYKMFYGCKLLKGALPKYDENLTSSDYANYVNGYFTKLVGKNGEEKIGAVGDILTADNLTLDDNKDFVAYEPFAAKDASYSRKMNAGTTWGTLCLPFGIDQSQETECKFYCLTGIDNDCITLESYEGAEIPAGTPVLFKMNEGEQTLSISAQDASIVTEPKAGTNTDVNLVGSFTKIGGKDNQGLTDTDYIIGKDKFWLVSELKKDGNSKGVGIKPMRAYIHPATASQARAAMLSIGKGDGTTAIDNLNAISNDANAEYYDANGRRTNGLQKGLNIVKRGSKTYKIMVK